MDQSPTVQDYLSALGSLFGAEQISLDEDGLCQFQHESGFSVTLIWQGDEVRAFTLSSDVAEVPAKEDRLDLYARLLRLNFLLIETGGATLAVDEDEKIVFLCRELPVSGLDEEQFVAAVAYFMVQSAEMRSLLGSDPKPSPSEGSFDPFSLHVIRS